MVLEAARKVRSVQEYEAGFRMAFGQTHASWTKSRRYTRCHWVCSSTASCSDAKADSTGIVSWVEQQLTFSYGVVDIQDFAVRHRLGLGLLVVDPAHDSYEAILWSGLSGQRRTFTSWPA